ncbi:FGGY-family carbohydrate kinase [Pseudomonas sp. 18175]|uniref:FGGY-family carbohydrate kinase n=1 Tax=Pseudomonas sp. 18175 TaxID=3390056 RepID=UPI003D256B51
MSNVSGTNLRAPAVLGVDIGSTNSKVVVVDMSGWVVSRCSRPTPRGTSDLSVSAEVLLETLEDMVIEACGAHYGIQAIAIAGIGEDGVLVDSKLMPVVPALAWFDPRRNAIFEKIERHFAPNVDMGVATDPSRALAGWVWALEQPNTESAQTWLALTDFAASRWAETPFISDTLAARTGAWNVNSGTWDTGRVNLCLGSASFLPPVRKTGDVIGELRSRRLAEAGVVLPEAVVVAGGHDHPIGGWGVTQMHRGAVLDSMGTAEVVVAQASSLVVGNQDLDVAQGICGNARTLLTVQELNRNVDWASQDLEVNRALRMIISGKLKPDNFLDSDCFIVGGRGGSSPSFSVDSPLCPISKASAVAGALSRAGNDAVKRVAQYMPANAAFYCAGGWARSPGWLSLKQSLSDAELRVIAEPEVTAVGAALLAAAAIGCDVDASVALSGDVKPSRTSFAPLPVALVR